MPRIVLAAHEFDVFKNFLEQVTSVAQSGERICQARLAQSVISIVQFGITVREFTGTVADFRL